MKEAVTKFIDSLTQEDFYVAFQKVLELYKCIAAGADYFERNKSFICVQSIKAPIRKKSGNLSYAPRIYTHQHRKSEYDQRTKHKMDCQFLLATYFCAYIHLIL